MTETKNIPRIIVEHDDELPDVYEKIEHVRNKNLEVFIPNSAILFRSNITLKILKRKIEELEKHLTIIISSSFYKERLEKLGFSVILEENKDLSLKTKNHEKGSSAGLSGFFGAGINKLKNIISNKKARPYNFSEPNRRPLLTFMVVSIVLFIFILYVTLPSATISIKPSLKVQKSSLNIEFVEASRVGKIVSIEDRIVPLSVLNVEYERKISLTPTGRTFKGKNANGKVTLMNKTKDPWPIVAGSRLQSGDGLVFTTNFAVNVPAGTAENPGRINVDVTAREKDAHDIFTGSRGNIGPSTFFLPGLSQFNQSLLTGESKEVFTGGTDEFDYFIEKNDITIADEKMRSELDISAVPELKKAIAQSFGSQESVKLFDRSDKLLQKEVLGLQVFAQEGQKINTFEVYGKMKVTGYYYNEKDIEQILVQNLTKDHLSPTEKVIKLKEHSLKIDEILEVVPESKRAKVNASLEGIIAYDFLGQNSDLTKRIQLSILGKKVKEAEQFINNQQEISEAKVSVWPIWSPTIPTIPENIKIQVVE